MNDKTNYFKAWSTNDLCNYQLKTEKVYSSDGTYRKSESNSNGIQDVFACKSSALPLTVPLLHY